MRFSLSEIFITVDDIDTVSNSFITNNTLGMSEPPVNNKEHLVEVNVTGSGTLKKEIIDGEEVYVIRDFKLDSISYGI